MQQQHHLQAISEVISTRFMVENRNTASILSECVGKIKAEVCPKHDHMGSK